jgi:TIR domain
MSSVFISYRRQTAAGEARALFNDLVARLGQGSVFMDVDSISLGRDFRSELQKTLAACDLMLVLIDKDWAAAKDERGNIRLQNARDFVRMEIEAALKRDIAVTPVLVKGAQMPAAEELPAEISDLAYRNGFELSHSRWESDVREMIRRLNLDASEQGGQVKPGRSKLPEKRPEAKMPPVTSPPPQTGVSSNADWLTRRRVLMTAAGTAMVGALGGGAYALLNRKEKEGPVAAKKEGPIPGTNAGPIPGTNTGPTAVMRGGPVGAIMAIAAQSAIARYSWRDRGVAPAGYIKGMALVYARVYRKLQAGNAVAIDMAQASTGDVARDALAYYDDTFARANMPNSVSAPDTLRHLFVLLIGLGMRESSGRYCQGLDMAATTISADNADAGMFGTTYAIRTASPLMTDLFNSYSACPSGFEDVFKEGLVCRAGDFKALGSGAGEAFQWLSKECPPFAAEVAALGLRHMRNHYGPIRRREAEVVPECDAMLREVQAFVDATPAAKLDATFL